MSDLTDIPNIGPATARALIAAGVPDAATLRGMGAHEAYRALLAGGERPHFIGYYVLHMGLQGRPWNDCRGEEKDMLRREFDKLVAQVRGADSTGIEAALREIGLIAPQPASRS
ncbi:TfoX/Sxy family protein [Paracoccus sp. KR1-242]|uniref:TfoX/Sxy family protein n=1 Tax=Paracoccus sp. KR1-242 TaxID=3410028 RepID=UPI003C056835